MSKFLSKFVLIFLMACIPLQGIAMQVKAAAQRDAVAGLAMAMHGDIADSHDCCPPGHADQAQMDHDEHSPAPHHSAGGECSHCPLCSVSAPPAALPPLVSDGSPALYPTPALHLSSFYPELPQRPPLVRPL